MRWYAAQINDCFSDGHGMVEWWSEMVVDGIKVVKTAALLGKEQCTYL